MQVKLLLVVMLCWLVCAINRACVEVRAFDRLLAILIIIEVAATAHCKWLLSPI